MADLSARFRLDDEMSEKLDRISTSGDKMVESWESAQSASAQAISSLTGDADRAAQATTAAAEAQGHWTNELGNYSSGALEAVYSTEELVSMGLQSADALREQQEMATMAEREMERLATGLSAASDAQTQLTDAQSNANLLAEKLSESDRSTTEMQLRLSTASQEAAAAQTELTAAQNEATSAMEAYNQLMERGGATTAELEAAAGRACSAGENLATANDKASRAVGNLSEETQKVSEEFDKGGKKGFEAVEAVSTALASAGIAKTLSEIAEATIEMANAFSEAESTIVKATGATGETLDGLTDSMMNAYASSKTGNMSDAAAAVGEINTRMALQGEELATVTEQFLDYAAITGTNVVGGVQNATKIMNKWGVEGDNVVDVLDRLAYAGQVSGANVNNLSSALISGAATYQAAGLTLDNTINMLADFELAGINSSSAMMGLRTAVSQFAKDGRDANTALLETVEAISTMESKTDATALAIETFGTRAGQELALTIRSGVLSVDTFTTSLEKAEGTLVTTADAAQTLDQKWEQANNNINAAFTKAVGPAIDKLSSGLASLTNGFGDFLNENETFTKFLVAAGVGLGVLVGGITAVAFASNVAIPAVIKFAGAVYTALGPVGLVTAGVIALGVAIGAFVAMSDDSTAALEALSREAGELNDKYGEVIARSNEITGSYKNTNAEIDTQYLSSQRLISQLKELDDTAGKTAGTEEQMKAIVDKLNEAYPQLGVTLEGVSGNLDEVIAKFEQVANADSKYAKYENAKQSYTDLRAEQDELKQAFDDAQDLMARAQKEYGKYNMGDGFVEMFGGTSERTKAFEEAQAIYDKAADAYLENQRLINECAHIMEDYGDIVNGTSDEQVSAYDAVKIALNKVEEASTELTSKYNENYQAAYDSISGQMGLFEQMAISCETSTDEMLAAMKSQVEYMSTYTENLKLAAQYGLDQGLIASLSDGSQESAGYLNVIIDKVKELGTETDAAAAFVAEMNGSYENVEATKQGFATTVADQQTDVTAQLENIVKTMEESIDKMNMDDEAAEAAKSTIEAYIDMLKGSQGQAVEAAATVAEAVNGALMYSLNYSNTPDYSDPEVFQQEYGVPYKVAGYATGTVNSEDVFMAGEKGPELIVGAQGSTVFPTSETDRIINAFSQTRPLQINAPSIPLNNDAPRTTSREETKRISIDIAGNGSIAVQGTEDKARIVELLTENIRPVLLNILEEEVFEEGEGTYDY